MNYYPKVLKKRLDKCILELHKKRDEYVKRVGKDFTRQRTLTFSKVMEIVITMGASSQGIELLKHFKFCEKTPTSSGLIQQRDKLKPEVFQDLLREFSSTLRKIRKYKNYRILAVDGTKVALPTDSSNHETHVNSNPNSAGFNLLHVNAFYDIFNKIYVDATIQPYRKANEHKGLIQMIKRLDIGEKVIIIADRGYESYNNFAHIDAKGWNYIFRIQASDSSSGILKKCKLPVNKEFDEIISVQMTRRQTNEIKSNPKLYRILPKVSTFDFLPHGDKGLYPLTFRVVCIKLDDDNFQYLITNLSARKFSPDDLKDLYKMRWGIETSFRQLKHTVAMLHFNSKKTEHIKQEIYAKMVFYNYCEMVALHVVIEEDNDKKYTYQVNFTKVVSICNEFLRCYNDKHPPNVEALIKRFIQPIRQERNFPRLIKTQAFVGFNYRVY